MMRILLLVSVAVATSCAWPPRPSAPPLAQNPAQTVEEAEPAVGAPLPPPSLPRVSPPVLSVPRVRGGLL